MAEWPSGLVETKLQKAQRFWYADGFFLPASSGNNNHSTNNNMTWHKHTYKHINTYAYVCIYIYILKICFILLCWILSTQSTAKCIKWIIVVTCFILHDLTSLNFVCCLLSVCHLKNQATNTKTTFYTFNNWTEE